MKRSLWALPAALLLIQSCSEDFEVDAPYKDVTAVYGLLNMADTAHYIRIQKAFLDETKDALVMAQVADSSFYKDLTVVMRDLMGGNVVANIPMQRVDVNQEGFMKATGTFFQSPNWAYKTTAALQPSHTYRLVITNNATGDVDSAETIILNSNPAAWQVQQYLNMNYTVSFTATRPTNSYQLDVNVPDSVRYVEATMRFRWTTKDAQAGTSVDDSADFVFAKVVAEPGRQVKLQVLETDFYPFLYSAIGPAPSDLIDRYIDSVDIYIWGSTQTYRTYLDYQSARGGITADQIRYPWTNIQGTDVLGLFTSRAVNVKLDVPLSNATVTALGTNPITDPLRIVGRSDH